MLKIALTILAITALVTAQKAKVPAPPAEPAYDPSLHYLSDIVRNTLNRDGIFDAVRKTPNYTTKNVSVSKSLTKTKFTNDVSKLIMKELSFNKDHNTVQKKALLAINKTVVKDEQWHQLSMILKFKGKKVLTQYQVLIRAYQDSKTKGKDALYAVVTNKLEVASPVKLEVQSISWSRSQWSTTFANLKVLYQKSNMKSLYGSDRFIANIRTYCNRVSLGQIFDKLKNTPTPKNNKQAPRKLQGEALATAAAVSTLINSFAESYTKVAQAVKTKITNTPILQILNNEFDSFHNSAACTKMCIMDGKWDKFIASPIALNGLIGKGLNKQSEEEVKKGLAAAEFSQTFDNNEKTIHFDKASDLNTAQSYTLTYTNLTKEAIAGKCVEYITCYSVVPKFKLKDNFTYISHNVSAAGGIADVSWLSKEYTPKGMSIEDIELFTGFIKAQNLDSLQDLVGLKKSATDQVRQVINVLKLDQDKK